MAQKLTSSLLPFSRSSDAANQGKSFWQRIFQGNQEPSDECAESKVYDDSTLNHLKDEIRLIRLLGSDRDVDPICIEIESVELANAPPYLALSYTWGNAAPTHELVVKYKGSAEPRSIKIRGNLYNFLWWYRRVNRGCAADGYLWIDQISINQSNVQERNHQVHLMSRIYTKSDHVLVWLGEKEERLRPHEQFVFHAAKAFSETKDREAYVTLLSNDYFKRLWIIQEVILAKRIKVLAGDTWLSWSELRSFSDTDPFGRRLSYKNSFKHSRDILQLADGTWKQRTLEECILTFSRGVCGDSRDKVYGLMGLVGAESRIEVDYTKSRCDVLVDILFSFMDRYLMTMPGKKQSERDIIRGKLRDALHRILGSMEVGHGLEEGYSLVIGRVFRVEALDRFVGLPCPITSMGVEPSPRYQGEMRWWYDFLGQRYYVEAYYEQPLDITHNRPLFMDWNEYILLAHQHTD